MNFILEFLSKQILVGGIPTPLKNMKVNGKDYPIYDGRIPSGELT